MHILWLTPFPFNAPNFQDATAAAMEAAAAAEAAEAAVDSLGLDSVGVGVDVHATDGDDEMALAAAGELKNVYVR